MSTRGADVTYTRIFISVYEDAGVALTDEFREQRVCTVLDKAFGWNSSHHRIKQDYDPEYGYYEIEQLVPRNHEELIKELLNFDFHCYVMIREEIHTYCFESEYDQNVFDSAMLIKRKKPVRFEIIPGKETIFGRAKNWRLEQNFRKAMGIELLYPEAA